MRTGSKPVKKPELGQSATPTELAVGPCFQFIEPKGFAAPGKVEFADQTVDPYVDGEGVPPAIGVQ